MSGKTSSGGREEMLPRKPRIPTVKTTTKKVAR
jgi:hypothetical protein